MWYKRTVLRKKRENEEIQFRMFQNFIKIRCGTRWSFSPAVEPGGHSSTPGENLGDPTSWQDVCAMGVIQNVGRTIKLVSWFDPASSRREQFATGGVKMG